MILADFVDDALGIFEEVLLGRFVERCGNDSP